jgi:hypothetical protein
MANWAYIENNKIIEVFDDLPKNWRNISNLNASEGDLQFLKSLGWYPIGHNSIDYNPATQDLRSLGVAFDGTTAYETWTVDAIPTIVLYNNFITLLKTHRDKLLKESDFMCLSDLVQMNGPAWEQDVYQYRQQLRDLPDLYTNPNVVYNIANVVWPTKPNMSNYNP